MRPVTEDLDACWLELCCSQRGALSAAGQPDPSDLSQVAALLCLEARLSTGTPQSGRNMQVIACRNNSWFHNASLCTRNKGISRLRKLAAVRYENIR